MQGKSLALFLSLSVKKVLIKLLLQIMEKAKYLPRRILMTTFGTLLCGISVGIFRNSEFGVDPFQCMCGGIATIVPIDFGTLYMIINIILIIFMFFFYRKSIGVYTFVNMFLLGYMIDFSDKVIRNIIVDPSVGIRFVLLIVGLTVLSIASAFIFSSNLGVSTYDWVALLFAERCKKVPFKFARIITDLICCLVGFMLGVIPGIATLITALCMGPFITFFRNHWTDPMIPKDARI